MELAALCNGLSPVMPRLIDVTQGTEPKQIILKR